MFTIRAFTETDREPLTALWLRSVRATHDFLTEDDIAFYLPMVRGAFDTPGTVVLDSDDAGPAGFMVLDANKVDALFIAPEQMGRGGGRLLLAHARHAISDALPLLVDVNEDNPEAAAFYRRLGFRQTGRSALDGTGRPFPLLHLELDGELTP